MPRTPNAGAHTDGGTNLRPTRLQPRRVALLATLAALLVLLPGCATVAKTMGKIVMQIATDVIVQAGSSMVQKIISPDQANGRPTVMVSFTDADGYGAGSRYAVNGPSQITTENVSIKNASGDIHIVRDSKGIAVTVAGGATATIEISFSTSGSGARGQQVTSSAEDQAATINGILGWSGRSRAALFAALDDLGACRDVAGATAALRTVAGDRGRQIDALADIEVSALPAGDSLRDTLLTALKYSMKADQAFVRWGRSQESGCGEDRNHDDAMGYSRQATATKKQFVSRWNRVATTYGLPQYQEPDI